MPKLIGTGQLTLADLNDVLASPTAPSNPIDGSMWWNTTENKLYIYNNGSWIFSADGITIGGRNILRRTSFVDLTGWTGYQAVNQNDFLGLTNSLLLTRTNWTTGQARQQLSHNIAVLPFTVATTQYTLSAWIYVDSSVALAGGSSNSLVVRFNKLIDSSFVDLPIIDLTLLEKDKWVHVSGVAKLPYDVKPNAQFLLSLAQNGKVKIARPQLELGNVATDWDKAPEDTEEVISDIQETLGNMANDGILDYNERQVIKDKITEIIGYVIADATTTLPTTATLDSSAKGTVYSVRKQAQSIGIPSTHAKYVAVDTKYTALKTYLEAMTPIDAWDVSIANQTKIINVTKSTFRDTWLQYYTAVDDLATYTMQVAKENVDNVTVGGTNYVSNGDFQIELTKGLWASAYVGQTCEIVDIGTEDPPFSKAFHVKNTTNANGGILSPKLWDGKVAEGLVDKEVTVSFWMKYQNIVQGTNSYNLGRFGELIVEGETAGAVKVYRYPKVDFSNNTSTESVYVSGTNMTWKKYYATIKLSLPATAVKLTKISFKFLLEGCTGEFWATGIKAELGNKVTDWSQSPFDVHDRISKTEFKVSDDQILLSVMQSETVNAQMLSDYTFENGVQYWKQDHALTTPVTGATIIAGQSSKGSNVVQFTGGKTIFYGKKMPIQSDHIYRVTFRVRQTTNPTTAGKSKIYAGVAGFDVNKGILTTGTFGLHRYCAVTGADLVVADGWKEYTGIITGEGDEGYGQFITGTRYAVPVLYVNYSGGDGTAQIDYCTLEDVTADENLANQVKGITQKFTADGIYTEISKSTSYKNFTDSLVTDQKLSDKKYATTNDVSTAVGNIDIAGGAKSAIDAMAGDANSSLVKTFATKLELQQTSQDFTTKFSATGGMNILRNSIGFSPLGTDIDDPDRNFVLYGNSSRLLRVSNDGVLTALGFGSAFQFNAGIAGQDTYIEQKVPVVIGKPYTLSWSAMKTNASSSANNDGSLWVQIREKASDGTFTTVKSFKYNSETVVETFTSAQLDSPYVPSTSTCYVRVYAYGLTTASVTGLMFSIGDIALQWSLATGESYNTNVRLDINGIRVSQYADAGGVKKEVGYTQISPDEFAGFYDSDGDGVFEKVFYLNGDETVTKKIKALNEFTMGSIKIVKVPVDGGTSTYTGWAFVAIT